MPTDPREQLPLPPHDFHVLLALLEAPRHAYGLSRGVPAENAENDENGGLRLEIGSLYRILARLTTQGLIEDCDPPGGSEAQDSRRRYYRITSLGRRVVAAEADRLTTVLRLARRRNLLPSK